MAGDRDLDTFDSGGVFTFGRSRFADDVASQFYIRNDPVIAVACGDEHTVCICQKGRVFVFGSNDYGQLGLGHKNVVTKPTCLKALKPQRALLVACGRAHTLLATNEGALFAWGCNADGQLGLGDTTDRTQPQRVEQVEGGVAQLAAGSQFSAALTGAGQVFVWGSNADSQLGVVDPETVLTPRLLVLDVAVIAVSCGYYHMALVTADGAVLTCGERDDGKLGRGDDACIGRCDLPGPATAAAAGGSHTVALLADGRAFAWGGNAAGQTGVGEAGNAVDVPTPVTGLRRLAGVACGESHTAFVTRRGRVLTCGDAAHGKLGLSVNTPQFQPQPLERFSELRVTAVSCGGCHTMVLASRREPNLADGFDDDSQSDSGSEDSVASLGGRALPPLQRLPATAAAAAAAAATIGNGNAQRPAEPADELRALEDEIASAEGGEAVETPERPDASESSSPTRSHGGAGDSADLGDDGDSDALGESLPAPAPAPAVEEAAPRAPGRVERFLDTFRRKRPAAAAAQSANERTRLEVPQQQQRAASEVVLPRPGDGTSVGSQHGKSTACVIV